MHSYAFSKDNLFKMIQISARQPTDAISSSPGRYHLRPLILFLMKQQWYCNFEFFYSLLGGHLGHRMLNLNPLSFCLLQANVTSNRFKNSIVNYEVFVLNFIKLNYDLPYNRNNCSERNII